MMAITRSSRTSYETKAASDLMSAAGDAAALADLMKRRLAGAVGAPPLEARDESWEDEIFAAYSRWKHFPEHAFKNRAEERALEHRQWLIAELARFLKELSQRPIDRQSSDADIVFRRALRSAMQLAPLLDEHERVLIDDQLVFPGWREHAFPGPMLGHIWLEAKRALKSGSAQDWSDTQFRGVVSAMKYDFLRYRRCLDSVLVEFRLRDVCPSAEQLAALLEITLKHDARHPGYLMAWLKQELEIAEMFPERAEQRLSQMLGAFKRAVEALSSRGGLMQEGRAAIASALEVVKGKFQVTVHQSIAGEIQKAVSTGASTESGETAPTRANLASSQLNPSGAPTRKRSNLRSISKSALGSLQAPRPGFGRCVAAR